MQTATSPVPVNFSKVLKIELVDGTIIENPGKIVCYNLLEDQPGFVAMHSDNYTGMTNESLKANLEYALNEGIIEIVNEGSLSAGGKYFVQCKLTKEFNIAGIDAHVMYTITDNRKGRALKAGATTILIICANTFASAGKELDLRIFHTSTKDEILQALRDAQNRYINNVVTTKEYFEALRRLQITPENLLRNIYHKDMEALETNDVYKLKVPQLVLETYSDDTLMDRANAKSEQGALQFLQAFTFTVSHRMKTKSPLALYDESYAARKHLLRMDATLRELASKM